MTQYLRAQYNLNDPAYISIIDDLPFWSAPFGIKLLDKVRYKKNVRALDIGFGFGFPLMELAMRLGPSSKVYGIDPGKAGMERTRLKVKYADVQNVELIEGVAEAMPFENIFFDLIISNNGLNNVQDLTKVLSECNRVSKMTAQFVFTFNTNRTFIELYDVFREVLKEQGLRECEEKIDAHIYSKRKPLSEFKNELGAAGFLIRAIDEDEFTYRFSDGTSMFNHLFMKLAFMEAWKEIVPSNLQDEIFKQIEDRLNRKAERNQGFAMRVPFVTMDCEKTKQIRD
jgi:ubiquinone/menaquinone biosynthesis C-methylase UbiE